MKKRLILCGLAAILAVCGCTEKSKPQTDQRVLFLTFADSDTPAKIITSGKENIRELLENGGYICLSDDVLKKYDRRYPDAFVAKFNQKEDGSYQYSRAIAVLHYAMNYGWKLQSTDLVLGKTFVLVKEVPHVRTDVSSGSKP